jgi:hypothetical protein
MEDRGLDVMNAEHQITAIKLMKDSAAYGIAMFPDGDINSSAAGSGSGADGNVLRDYSHEMVQERAKMNMELEMEAEAGCPPSSHLPDVPSLPARPSSTSLTVDQLIVKHITDTLTADQSASKDLHNLIRDKDSTTVSSARAIEMYAFGVGIKGRFMKSTVNINVSSSCI